MKDGEIPQSTRITQDLADQISSLKMVSAIHTATISSLDQMVTESERRVVKITEESDKKWLASRLTSPPSQQIKRNSATCNPAGYAKYTPS